MCRVVFIRLPKQERQEPTRGQGWTERNIQMVSRRRIRGGRSARQNCTGDSRPVADQQHRDVRANAAEDGLEDETKLPGDDQEAQGDRSADNRSVDQGVISEGWTEPRSREGKELDVARAESVEEERNEEEEETERPSFRARDQTVAEMIDSVQ